MRVLGISKPIHEKMRIKYVVQNLLYILRKLIQKKKRKN